MDAKSIAVYLFLTKIDIMRFFIAGFIVSSIIISSCSPASPEKDVSLMNSVQSTKAAVVIDSQPVVMPITTVAPAAEKKPQGNMAAFNPAHGMPGHRCDIAVGAPLNSSPATTAAPAAKTINTINTQPVQAPVKTAAGMNPPHGEPGHRCDIAVGAPLNSPPAEKTPPVTVDKPDSVGT